MAKATATCTCATCGAKFEKYAIKNNRREADNWEAWAADYYVECDECYKARIQREREEKNKEAAEVAAANKWPALTGTEKQVGWAESIRAAIIAKAEEVLQGGEKLRKKYADDAEKLSTINDDISIMENVMAYFMDQTSASWWIENRNTRDLVGQTYRDIKSGVIIVTPSNPEPDTVEVPEENPESADAIIRPENQKFDGVAEISIDTNGVSARFAKSDAFREILKDLGYKWDSDRRCWVKKVNYATGSAADRAAELGNKLLNAGFAVSINDPVIRQAAIDAAYEPECHRWIALNPDGTLSITWDRQERNFYSEARRLPKAKWKDGEMTVPAIEYKSVLEFANTYGFKLSPGALEKINELEAASKVVVPTSAKEAQYDEHPISDVLNSSREVLDDLKDN